MSQAYVPDLELRVNGIACEAVSIQLGFEDGYPGGSTQLAIDDPVLGEIVLTSDCVVEIREGEGEARGPWRRVAPVDLLRIVERKGEAAK